MHHTFFIADETFVFVLISAFVSATEHVQTLHILTETEKTQNEQVFLTSIQLCSCSVNMQATIPTFDLTFFFNCSADWKLCKYFLMWYFEVKELSSEVDI